MSRFRVFLGAPEAAKVDSAPSTYQWQTITSVTLNSTSQSLHPAALESASRRISSIYESVFLYNQEYDEESYYDEDVGIDFMEVDSLADHNTTMITWPPTQSQSQSQGASRISNGTSFRSRSGSVSRIHSLIIVQTQGQESEETTGSYDYSDASSIAHFPNFHFTLHSLTPLVYFSSKLIRSRKINTLVAVLEVDGPDIITIKKGVDAGKEVAILKMILGDADGGLAKLTAWREVAETWGGMGFGPGAKRGDILLLENVMASSEVSTTPTLTASPNLKSKMEICYRTMPSAHIDKRLRPDLRLGRSDAAVRKVASVVTWFEGLAGLPRSS